MNEEKTFSDILFKSTLAVKLISLVKPIVSSHLEQCLADKSLNYDELGNEHEKKLKKAIAIYANLGTVVSDLEKVVVFLKLDKEKVSQTYPDLSLEEYYNYHLENYVIRINSLPDILAQLGNTICNWGIPKKKCYGTTIPDSTKVTNEDIKNKMQLLLSKISSIRTIRNEKIHTGDAEIGYFDKSLCWDTLPTLGIPLSPLLEEYSKGKKVEAIDLICDEVVEVINIVAEILNIYDSYL